MSSFDEITSIQEMVRERDSLMLTDPLWQQAESRLRSLLISKYREEECLCLKSNHLPSYIHPGFTRPEGIRTVEDLSRISDLIPRAYCEYNPLYKQIVPYPVVLSPSNEVYVLEKDSKVSLGFVTHIKNSNDILHAAMLCLKNQIEFSENEPMNFEGFLIDPPDMDHLIFIFTIIAKSAITKDKSSFRGSFYPVAEIQGKLQQMPRLSQQVYNSLFVGR